MDEDYNDQMDSWLQIELDGRARAARKAAERVEKHNRKLLLLFIVLTIVVVGAICEFSYYGWPWS